MPVRQTDDLPLASIVVTVKNEEQTIETCLGALLDLDYGNYEILVVDTGSTDNTYEIVERIRRGNPKITSFATVGNASTGRNLGLREATGGIIAFTDGDCIVTKDWLRTLVRSLVKDGHSTAGVGGPNVPLFAVENRWTTAARQVLSTFLGSAGSVQFRNSNTPYVRGLSTANSAFWTESVRKIGCFDRRLDLCEDADLCSRLAKTGSKLKFERDALVYHSRDYQSPWKFGRHLFRYGKWRGKAMVMKPSVDTSHTSLAITGGLAVITLLLMLSLLGNSTAESIIVFSASLYVLVIALQAAMVSGRVLGVFATVMPSFLILHASYAAGLISGILSAIPQGVGRQS